MHASCSSVICHQASTVHMGGTSQACGGGGVDELATAKRRGVRTPTPMDAFNAMVRLITAHNSYCAMHY
jgi:hypothetical protein